MDTQLITLRHKIQNINRDDLIHLFELKETENNYDFIPLPQRQIVINQLASIYETICALEKNCLTWDQVSIETKDKVAMPYEDVGLDLLTEDLTYAGQVKHYHQNNLVRAEDINRSILCFYHMKYNQPELGLNYIDFLTPAGVKLSNCKLKFKALVQHSIVNIERVKYWLEQAKSYQPKVNPSPYALRPCQVEALQVLDKNQSCSLKLICGAGKTDIICYFAKNLRPDCGFLILVPRLILVDQWVKRLKSFQISGEEISVCGTDYVVNLTARIIICVYNSIEKVLDRYFDYWVIDEAHHVEKRIKSIVKTSDPDAENLDEQVDIDRETSDEEVEKDSSDYSNDEIFDSESLDEESSDDNNSTNETESLKYLDIIARHAKNNITTLLSASLNGPVDYQYTMRQGINDKVLVDYQIFVPVFNHGDYENPLIQYITDHPDFISILMYCNTIAHAEAFNQLLLEYGFSSAVLTCNESRSVRNNILSRFRRHELRIIVSVNVLGEGIDIKEADTCIFVDKRSSVYSIIQCVGRVLRTCKGKTMAKIVLPCIENGSDDSIAEFIDKLSMADSLLTEEIGKRNLGHRIIVERIGSNGQENQEECRLLYETIIDRQYSIWDNWYEKVVKFKTEFGRLPWQVKNSKNDAEIYERKLARWLGKQKVKYWSSKLSPEKLNKLSKLGVFEDKQETKYQKVVEFKNRSNILPRRIHNPKNVEEELELGLAQWINIQKTKYKNGKLSNKMIIKLNAIGALDRIKKPWEVMFQLLSDFKDKFGKLPRSGIKTDTLENEKKLGQWLSHQRIKYKNNKLNNDQISKLKELQVIN
jgi:superfamily II DNA or RNA helicase